ncbi:MAG: GntR family transcriptional regulator [Armatimonadota bacterium]|nr:GntR family transcriptional regulator [Armatimonadota bacterium]
MVSFSLPLATVAESVARALQEEILSGRLAPGLSLRQRAVAVRFGVSEGVVREAFRRLEAQGLVESQRRRGVRVARLSKEELRDLYDVRIFVEPLLARESAGRAPEEDLATARGLCDAMERESDAVKWLGLNRDFHMVLYRASGRTFLLRLQDQLRILSDRYLRLCLEVLGRFEASNREHWEILAAYEARDPEAAAQRVRRHLEEVRGSVSAALGEQVASPLGGLGGERS